MKLCIKRFFAAMTVIAFIYMLVLPIAKLAMMPKQLNADDLSFEQLKVQNTTYSITHDEEGATLAYKLFDLIPLKQIDLKFNEDRKVYIGGFPIGISIKTDGVLIERMGAVETAAGKVDLGDYLMAGDIITEINGERVVSIDDMNRCLNSIDKSCGEITVKVSRSGVDAYIKLVPPIENLTGKYKLGAWVRDSILGVGTVTYVEADGSFGALGHPIMDASTGIHVPCYNGSVFNCKIIGVKKGRRGCPGELKASLSELSKPIGDIEQNHIFGVYGKIKDFKSEPYLVAPRTAVTSGKAQIYTTVNDKADFYDIEIIRAINQDSKSDKGMVLRVTDKRLIDLTGGVVQGMSGSPIIQNGKLIGSVTHVFTNDPTKGYGIYLDWMLGEK